MVMFWHFDIKCSVKKDFGREKSAELFSSCKRLYLKSTVIPDKPPGYQILFLLVKVVFKKKTPTTVNTHSHTSWGVFTFMIFLTLIFSFR